MTWTAHHPRPEPRDTVPAALAVCAIAHRQIQRAERPVHWLAVALLIVAIGCGMGWALAEFVTPCEGLC